ncbi:hypothetical protein IMZ48_39955 [Candidatus Bathyarchaeota archaeon]|nr:hypothetical protein [Candidatus Bathyarchaeota archaeon]
MNPSDTPPDNMSQSHPSPRDIVGSEDHATHPEDMSLSHPSSRNHPRTMTSEGSAAPAEHPEAPTISGLHPVEGHLEAEAPAISSPYPAEGELDLEDSPAGYLVPSLGDNGAHGHHIWNTASHTVDPWVLDPWAQDPNTPVAFQNPAVPGLVHPAVIPEHLPIRTPAYGYILPLTPPTSPTSTLEAEASDASQSPIPPSPALAADLVSNIEEDLRGVGQGLLVDPDQGYQHEERFFA